MQKKITITLDAFNIDQETELLIEAIKAVLDGKDHHHDIHKNPITNEVYGYFVNVQKRKTYMKTATTEKEWLQIATRLRENNLTETVYLDKELEVDVDKYKKMFQELPWYNAIEQSHAWHDGWGSWRIDD